MELSIPVKVVNPQYIFFAEKRKNVIVDGNFIKITYSTAEFEMTGLHIHFDVDLLPGFTSLPKNWAQVLHKSAPHSPTRILRSGIVQSKSGSMDFTSAENRRSIHFNLNSANNTDLIDRLCNIEKEIVDRYIACNCPSKLASYILKTQLLSGVIKYNSDNKIARQSFADTAVADMKWRDNIKEKCVLKISGIWETASNAGITMKFILLS